MPMPTVVQGLLIILVTIAAWTDVRSRRIPNWLALAGLITGIGLNSFLFEVEGLKASLMGAGLAMLVYFPLFGIRAMGAGDVKLMIAVGSMAGPGRWMMIFVLSAIVGGLLAVVLVATKGRLATTFRNVAFILGEIVHFRPPYMRREELDVNHPKAVALPHALSIAFASFAFVAFLRFGGVS